MRELRDVGFADAPRTGRKAAALGELSAAGFPVPDGFVLTVDALRRTLDYAGLRTTAAREDQVATVVLPDDVLGALRTIAERTEGVPLAVRSTGVDEDLAGSSFAGQYTTVLAVVGIDALVTAVRACWASAFSARVASYRAANGIDRAPSMAVLVQHLVPATAAGVAFTANVVTGDRTEVLVSAVRGLGERLVSGLVTPDEWVVGTDGARRTHSSEDAVTAARVVEVAELARAVEAHFDGVPQDIEWAVDGAGLHLLQARPITTLSDVEVPPGHWQRDALALRPMTPMHLSTVVETTNSVVGELFRYGLAAGTETRALGGWPYWRIVGLDEQGGSGNAFGDRIREIVAAVRSDEPVRTIDRWYAEWQPELAAELDQLRDVPLAGLADDALREHLLTVRQTAAKAQRLHFTVGGACGYLVGDLGVRCRDELGWTTQDTLLLLTGIPGKTSEPGIRIRELATLVADSEDLTALLSEVDGMESAARVLGTLASDYPDFAERFERYRRDYAHRGLGNELAEPTMAEQPALLLGLIRDQVLGGTDIEPDPSAGERVSAEERAVAGLDGDIEGFRRMVRHAQRAYPVRDDSVFHSSTGWALLRYALLETGRRLVARGQLDEPADVFLLTWREALDAVDSRADARDAVKRRAEEHEWAARHPGPASYGERPAFQVQGGADDFLSALPAEAAHSLQVAMWGFAAASDTKREQADGHTGPVGLGASPGRYTGPARIVLSEQEFGKVRPGDVLVCPLTTAQWSVLFTTIGALVTDLGGLLSHPAIIARECRIPAVVAAGDATRQLRDGQLVTVDGTTGRIEIAAAQDNHDENGDR
ncbi:PEP/pyruvate-binding domain-containing protein [Actinokineospora enzanensis]|uniref:PEP/pyruvate-binding domain-containing protein n=1 Tax=Actinokineospora enzanensis TaxID=155975 RepID=UPI00146C1F53|nr:PEP/pyruvate-binding domain-containing protein [Actinokineospora enzanensis]